MSVQTPSEERISTKFIPLGWLDICLQSRLWCNTQQLNRSIIFCDHCLGIGSPLDWINGVSLAQYCLLQSENHVTIEIMLAPMMMACWLNVITRLLLHYLNAYYVLMNKMVSNYTFNECINYMQSAASSSRLFTADEIINYQLSLYTEWDLRTCDLLLSTISYHSTINRITQLNSFLSFKRW